LDLTEQELTRRTARNRLIEFTQYTFPKFQPGKHHREIADALESVERGECDRLMIFAPPRHTKSELASRRFPAWYLGKHPDRQVITTTYASEFAQDFGRDVREIVGSEEFNRLFPDVSLAADSAARGRWHTNHGGVYFAVGVGGPITGRGAHLALIDDPIKNRQDAESQVIRDSVWHWYTSTLRTRLMPGGAIVLICTRWHEDDLAGRLLNRMENKGEQWRIVSLPAVSDAGSALWPEWYPIAELDRLKSSIGPRDWLSLYQQSPTAESGTYFQREWFRHYTAAPENLNYYITGDFAVSADEGDYTELAVWGTDPLDNIYAVDWWSGRKTADIWIERLLDFAQRYNPSGFIGEMGPIRRAIEPLLERRMRERGVFIAPTWMSTNADKAATARSFQGLASMGRVYWPKVEWAERVIDQCLRFPSGRWDDAVDACSLLGRHLANIWSNRSEPAPIRLEDAWNNAGIMQAKDMFRPMKKAS
jgi:predicted phage terminase large subunit-like protein